MYSFFLTLHSWLRWVVVIVAVVVLLRVLVGWLGRRGWTSLDDRLGMLFVTGLDVQLLVGLILYVFLSPITTGAFGDFGTAMSTAGLRYWVVEHTGGMLVAVVLAHVGRALSKRGTDPRRKHRLAAIFYGLALLVLLGSIPWPFLPTGRPLLRF